MTWLRIDDKMPRNPKIVGLSDAAFRAMVTAWAYAAEQETDGHIPDAVWRSLAKTRPLTELVDAGLFDRNGSGFVANDFTDWNPTKASLDDRRAKRSAAGSRGAAARWNKTDEE